MTPPEYAERIGVGPHIIYRYIRHGVLKKSVSRKGKRWQIRAGIADKELDENLDIAYSRKAVLNRRSNGGSKSDNGGNGEGQSTTASFAEARTLERQYAAGLRKLEYDRKRKALIDAAEVKRIAFECAKQVKEGCLSIADRCAPVVAAENDVFRCKQILLDEITIILENMADEITRIV